VIVNYEIMKRVVVIESRFSKFRELQASKQCSLYNYNIIKYHITISTYVENTFINVTALDKNLFC
jgi:hypothetical protein